MSAYRKPKRWGERELSLEAEIALTEARLRRVEREAAAQRRHLEELRRRRDAGRCARGEHRWGEWIYAAWPPVDGVAPAVRQCLAGPCQATEECDHPV